ncbi:putative ribonuclease H-like domain-containing protein [Tanacetum coccineum]
MDLETAQLTTTTKLPTLKQEKGNSFKPAAKTTTNADGTSTTLIPSPVTTKENVQKKNDMKARINTAYGVSTANTQVSPASTQVSTASAQVSTANLCDDTIYAFLASQLNGSQLVHEDLKQIHEDNLEEMDLKWQLALLSMRTRRFFQKTGRKITINGSDTAGYDKSKVEFSTVTSWDTLQGNAGELGTKIAGTGIKTALESYMADDEVPTNMALMDFSDSENEVIFCEQLAVLKRDISYKDSEISVLKGELEKLKQEKESNQLKIENFDNASKSLDKLIGSQIPDKSRKGLGFPEFEGYGPKTSKNVCEDTSNKVRESPDASMVEKLVLDDKLEKKIVFPIIAKIEFVRAKQQEKPVRKPVKYAEMYSAAKLQLPSKERVVSGNNYTRVNYNYSAKNTHPSTQKNMVPRAVLMKTGLRSLNTARPVNIAHPKTTVYSARPISNFSKAAQSTVKRPYQTKTALTNKNSSQKVNTAKRKVYTVRPNSAVVNAVRANQNRVLVVKPYNKTPYEFFRGRTPALSFMRPFGCHVTILNTLDYLGKFDGKSDDGFFVGYSLNSKAFRVYNIRTRRVEENLHIRFLEDKPIIAGDRPKWLFDIDVLTKSMNYVLVVVGTNSNDFEGTEESIGAGHSSMETGSNQDYILMPLWKDGSLFDSSSKNASNDEPQPSSDAGKKDGGVRKESGIDNQERPENSTQDINTVGPSINTTITNITTGDNATLEATHVDFFSDEIEVDMSNITTIYPVPSTLNTRIHKDHSLDHVIGDVQSGRAIGTKWVYRNKKDERGIVIRNKARMVTQGYTQEEGIDYDEVFAPVARIEAIRLFLAYALFKYFVVYQMDVKSAFLYGKIEKEVYRGQIDKTLFIKRIKSDILLVQVYVDDIIFGSTKKELCTEFEKLMHKKFQMSSMGELTFFLGLQVSQKDDGIFINQDKYVDEILKKFDFSTVKTASTPIETSKPLLMDVEAEDVDVHLYRSMIGSLMYLTTSRPDIIYLKGQPKLGLWYPKDSPFDLEAYTDSDYAGASLDRKSTIGEYVAVASCCGQVLWIQNQMLDYGYNFMNTKIYINNESTICIVKNPVFDSKTKYIEIRHHFIRDSNEKKLIQMSKIHTDHNVANLLKKAFNTQKPRKSKRTTEISQSSGPIPLVANETVIKEWEDIMEMAATTASSLEVEQDSGNINRTQSMATLNESFPQGTGSSSGPRCQDTTLRGAQAQIRFETAFKQSNDPPLLRVNTLGSREDSMKLKELMDLCTKLPKKLEDSDGISNLPTTEIFEQLALMGTYIAPTLTQKLFSNMRSASKGYTGVDIPLFPTMLVQGPVVQGEGSTHPVESHHTPTSAPSTSQPPSSSPSRRTTRQESVVPQPRSPTQTNVADEAASTGVDVRHGGAATTVTSLDAGQGSGNIDKTPSMPHDSPLPRVHTLGSDEGRMQHNELMDLVTKLSDRVVALETDLQQTKKVYGTAFTKLIKKVKKLEKTVKTRQARRKARIVVSDDEEDLEDPSKQGRKIAEIDQDPDISLVQHDAEVQGRHEHDMEPDFEFTAAEEVYTAEKGVSTAEPVSTAGASVSTASASSAKDKGKAIMEEAETIQTKTKQRIARVQEEASSFNIEEWDDIQARVEADEEFAQRLQSEEREMYSEAKKARLLAELIMMRKTILCNLYQRGCNKRRNRALHKLKQRTYMSQYIKNMGSHTLKQLKSYSFDEIKNLFETTMRRVHTFVPMESESERVIPELAAGSSKRDAKEELVQESSKRLKTGESLVPAEEPKDKEELSQNGLQQKNIKKKQKKMMIIVPEQGMNVEALQTKYPIIYWEIYTKGARKYWKIIRVGNHTKVYQFFNDMLKAFDREDLVKLWSLVKEKFTSTEPTEDKEREIWVELKRLFEPDIDAELWKIQKHIHDNLTWKLYDSCGVHHVFTEDGIDIYILVEIEYPLSRGTLTLMLVAKLLVEQDSEMSRELLRKIFMHVERPKR